MPVFSKRVGIQIPKHIGVFYNQKKNHLLLVGPFGSQTIILEFKLFLATFSRYIYILTSPVNLKKKQVKCFCGSLLAQMKQVILELSVKYHIALKLIGVGFKVYSFDTGLNSVLQFKLGFSHFIFYKIPLDTRFALLKNIKLFISNPCLKKVTQISAFIRSFKVPDIYKGKGFSYNKETLTLKKGKKVL
jgi:large subunit ribosomal protein L6